MSGYTEPSAGTTTEPTSTRFGNKPIRAVMKLLSGVELDTAPSYGVNYMPKVATPFRIRHDKFRLYNNAFTLYTDIDMAAALAVNQKLRIPILDNEESGLKVDDLMMLNQIQSMKRKTIPISGVNPNIIQDLTATNANLASFDAGGSMIKSQLALTHIPDGLITASKLNTDYIRNIASDFDVYLSGGEIRAKNNRTGLVQFTHANDVGAITNSIIATRLTTGGKIRYANDLFTQHTPITIPTTDNGASRPWHFEGYKPSNVRDFATQFKIGNTFPTNRYMFECVAADASLQNATVRINGIFANNRSYAADGNGTSNILAGADGPEIINAGFLKFEADRTATVGGGVILHLEDIAGHYLWRGIHILGYVYWPVIWNCSFSDFNNNFTGDFDLKFERGTGGAQHGTTVENKGADIRNFKTTHIGGKDGGRGSMNDGVVFFGGYHHVSHVFLNGRKYNNAVVSWKQCFSSYFEDINSIDLTDPQGASFQAVFLLDTADPAGNPATTNYTTYNNQISKINGADVSNGSVIKFLNGAFRNRLVNVYGYWGNNVTIDDAGAGIENVVEIIEGQQQAATLNSKITSTNSLVRIIDRRVGSSRRFIHTASGTGSQTVFNIPHGCFSTPVDYDVKPLSTDAFGAWDVTADATNIIVTYKIAPPGGTANNIRLRVTAEVYAH